MTRRTPLRPGGRPVASTEGQPPSGPLPGRGRGAHACHLSRRQALGLITLAAAAPVAAAEPTGARHRPWPRGRPTPALTLPLWEGGQWSLARSRGRVVVANFWASWCPPCLTELPSLELLAARHEADGLEVLAVNFRETDAAVRRFLDRNPLTLPVLRDTDGGAAQAFGIRIFPTTVVFGRDGRAAFTVTGECDWGGPGARAWIAAVL